MSASLFKRWFYIWFNNTIFFKDVTFKFNSTLFRHVQNLYVKKQLVLQPFFDICINLFLVCVFLWMFQCDRRFWLYNGETEIIFWVAVWGLSTWQEVDCHIVLKDMNTMGWSFLQLSWTFLMILNTLWSVHYVQTLILMF